MKKRIVLVFSLTLVLVGLAPETAPAAQQRLAREKASGAAAESISGSPSGESSPNRVSGFTDVILGTNFSVSGGGFRDFDAGDVGGAERIAISALSSANNINQVRVRLFFGAPDATQTVAPGDIRGSDSTFVSVVTGFVTVHGSRATVRVLNDGSSTVTLQQVTIYLVR